ncbi:hypothetical protein [Kocuria sp. cx-455]|uniref:hypothetical protein n=1 Tax=Kocuria sp. cx-455 TaxID=2771377 RepID=UPI003D72BBC9
MSAPTFDVRAYMRDPYVLYPADLDMGTMGSLSGPTLETLSYLWTVENHVLDRMRDLLVTPTHAESRVTAFLSTWAHEQHWLGATLQALMSTNVRPLEEPGDTRLGHILRVWDDRCRPTVAAIGTNLLKADITGAHMVTGWLDTAVVATLYRRLGRSEPALEDLMTEVGRLKDRHMAFYAPEAHNRLADAASARRVARVAVSRWRFPGTRYAGPAPVRTAVAGFFADPGAHGAVAELDRTVALFPGLTGAHPARKALGQLAPETI